MGETSSPFREGWFAYSKLYLSQIPVHTINFDDHSDKYRHSRMVEMVEQMLELKKEHAAAEAMLEDRRHDLAREIENLDAQIDQLVYELYGLTEEEIALVEASS
jgi:phosphate uptake regulator